MCHAKQTFLVLSLLISAANFASAHPPQGGSDCLLQEHRNQIVRANLKFKLPEAKKIEETLQAFSPPDFLTQAKLGTKLAGQHLCELGIEMVLIKTCHEYAVSLNQGSDSASQVHMKIRQLGENNKGMIDALVRISTQL